MTPYFEDWAAGRVTHWPDGTTAKRLGGGVVISQLDPSDGWTLRHGGGAITAPFTSLEKAEQHARKQQAAGVHPYAGMDREAG